MSAFPCLLKTTLRPDRLRGPVMYATFWMIVLWATGHPPDEWAVAVGLLYGLYAISVIAVVGFVLLSFIALHWYAGRILDKLGLERPDETDEPRSWRYQFMLALILIAVLLATFGLAVGLTSPVLIQLDLSPLAYWLQMVGWGGAALGIGVLSIIIGGFALVFATASLILHRYPPRLDRIDDLSEEITEGLQPASAPTIWRQFGAPHLWMARR